LRVPYLSCSCAVVQLLLLKLSEMFYVGPASTYKVNLRAFNDVGEGVVSSETITTLERTGHSSYLNLQLKLVENVLFHLSSFSLRDAL